MWMELSEAVLQPQRQAVHLGQAVAAAVVEALEAVVSGMGTGKRRPIAFVGTPAGI